MTGRVPFSGSAPRLGWFSSSSGLLRVKYSPFDPVFVLRSSCGMMNHRHEERWILMGLTFTKMHGLGNDFVVVDGMNSRVDLPADQVEAICDRHRGVGADGVITVRPGRSQGSSAFMDYINADGTPAQMCGNGVRVTAKYLVDHGYVAPESGELLLDTRAGVKRLTFEANRGRLDQATVNMGPPELDPASIPVRADSDSAHRGMRFVGSLAIDTQWGAADLACVSMGNPHAVWFVGIETLPETLFAGERSLQGLDLTRVGPVLESAPVFPEKANIEFVTVEDDGLHMRVYERGVGETLACGTGACAVLVAAYLTGRSGPSSDVHLPGGTLAIDWRDDGVYMTGPAATVYSGTWN